MTDNKLTINWMFPDLLNLYGDKGNIMAIERLGQKMGLRVEINRIEDLSRTLAADLTFFNSGDLDVITMLAAKKERLLEFLKPSRKIIVFGTSVALFGTKTTRIDHPGFEGLNLIKSEITERPIDLLHFKYPAGNDYLLEPVDDSICDSGYRRLAGVYVKSILVKLCPEVAPFAKVLYGLDNSGELEHSGFDGAVSDNILWTNLLGPALVKNPWLALALIEEAANTDYIIDDDMKAYWDLELQSFQEFLRFIKGKS